VPYWLPDPLPLPKRTRALCASAGPIDLAASWYWMKRLKRATDAELDTLSDKDWGLLRYATSTSYQKPSWMCKAGTYKSKGLYGIDDWHSWIPTIRIHPRFELLCVPFVTHNGCSYRYDEDSEPGTRYLAVRIEGERRRVYPRSLIAPRHSRQPQRTLRPDTMERLAPLWDAAFDALPALARTQMDALSGMPTLAASLPETPYDQRLETTHPFWIHASALAWTAMGLCRVHLPRPDTNYGQHYHWTVFSPRFEETNPGYRAGPLRVEMEPYGWFNMGRTDKPPPVDGDVLARLEIARKGVEVVLNRFAPFDVPLFFDTLHVSNLGGYRFDDEAWGKSMPLTGTGQHFPWLRTEAGNDPATLHTGFRWAKTLPPTWLAAFHEAVGPLPTL
jgi:hypothetical protein